jgi:hypothetical protein
VVVAIDDVHTDFANLVRIRKALVRFLDEDLGPHDLVALVAVSGTGRVSQEFTSACPASAVCMRLELGGAGFPPTSLSRE